MNPSYVDPNFGELYSNAPEYIQELIHGEEVNNATAVLGKLYKLQITQYTQLSNLISFILVGALKPEDAVRGIMDMLLLPEEQAINLAKDLDKTILERARIKILGKAPTDMVTLTFKEGRSPDELRKEILDTTKRGPLVDTAQPATPQAATIAPYEQPKAASKPNLIPGSRSALMDQLKLLDDIPNDDEIAERLKKIQQQIASGSAEDRTLDPAIPLQTIMPKDGVSTPVEAVPRPTPGKSPTKYSVDPYREVVEE